MSEIMLLVIFSITLVMIVYLSLARGRARRKQLPTLIHEKWPDRQVTFISPLSSDKE